MEQKQRSINALTMDGGWLSLDFVNTIADRNELHIFDYLSSYSHILDWSSLLNILTEAEIKSLRKLAIQKPKSAATKWIQALEVREMLFRLFQRILNGDNPNVKDQITFNKWLSKSLRHTKINFEARNILTSWNNLPTDFDQPIYRIIKSAYDLLISDKVDRIKECSACGWLFLDKSKNKCRKWCNMETCGSKEKSRSYYHRQKKINN